MRAPHSVSSTVRPSPSRLAWLACWVTALAIAFFAAAQARAQAPSPQDPPNVMVQKAANNVLERIRKDAELKSGSPAKINQAIDELILPYVDFEKTTRLAVGRYWRQATPEQRAELVKEFRNMLVRTYGGAVSSITPQARVDMRPYRAEPDATDVVVRTTVSDGQRDPIPVDYRLGKSADGWKIYDLNVMGVWFIENYRNQFASFGSQGGVEAIIKALKTHSQKMNVPEK
ncbi:putative phospholipid-binding protein MlaC precursor [Pigmentiphaga humi]|uniref:Putative phospholipid-binding protein MlaC n=1 Tax=Pigmentiphaga humi TaxID=2478468 RepID=A0A3P4B2E5_9BURK|nr:ABC transporter substrate-binding protein [Pigmentiphaga humi]VCU70457.1 putative phospholipid-binding protein MlaC precursor [Pigmentiphaga humi]